MSDYVDHVAEAQRLVGLSSIQTDTDSACAVSSAAQAHALLAIAEQLRIANVIELAKGAAGTEAQQAARSALVIETLDGFSSVASVRPEIREGLGL